MKLLLDEDVPEPLIPILERVLVGHEVRHVSSLGWRGKKDKFLLPDAARKGFRAVLTNDLSQFSDPEECDAIKRSGMHHITYEIADGLQGLAMASAAILTAIRPLAGELEQATSQRIAHIVSLSKRRVSYHVSNPATDPPSNYW